LVKTIIETGIPKVKQYMSEQGRAMHPDEIAEYLEVTTSTAYGVLDLMDAFGIVQKVKRGRIYFFLKDVYSNEQIMAMLPPEKPPHIPKTRGRPRLSKPQMRRDSFRDEYLSAMRERTSSSDGLSALAILGLPQREAAEIMTTEPSVDVEPDLGGEDRKPEPLINIKPFGTVKHLSKNVRLLSRSDTWYLKNLLKGLGVFEGLERYNTAFSKVSALKHGRYGEVFYLSMGSNPWDKVRMVTVNSSFSNHMVLPIMEANRWASWNDFLVGLKETRRHSGSLYNEMLDRFMESSHNLVEITVYDRGASYVKHMLKKKIEERGIMDHVKTSRVDEWVYLEKVE